MLLPHDCFDQVLVISLSRASDRRRLIKEQFANHNIEFQFVEAIDGRDIDQERMYVEGFVRDSPYMHRRLGRGEIACALSHRKAWWEVVRHYDNALICEDDLLFRHDSIRIFDDVMTNAPTPWDILHFSSYLNPKRVKFNNCWEIARFEYGGAQCYAITKEVAAYLISTGNPIDNVLDKITATVTRDSSRFHGYICKNVFDHDGSAHSYIEELGR